MLMQSSNAPNPNYEFILNDRPQVKTSKFSSLPKGIALGVGGLIAIMVIILIYGLFFSGNTSVNSTGMLDMVGKSQEISRISAGQQALLKDPNIAALAATTAAITASDQSQATKYLTSHKVKVDKKKLAVYQTNDKTIDDQLAQAASNNNLDTAYMNYLKTALTNYTASLKTTYAATSSETARAILQTSFNSSQTLLNSSLLKS
jgi:hypothetical protein